MNESILNSIKYGLGGLEPTYTWFDSEIIMAINSSFFVLNQLGVGPKDPFVIHGSKEVWGDFMKDISKIELLKSYIVLKVKLMFDPPSSSSILEVYKSMISEYEWRLNAAVDPNKEENSK